MSRVHIQIDKYRLDICQKILVFHPLQNTRIGDLAMHDTMSALFIILPVRRFRSCLNDHIHGTIADEGQMTFEFAKRPTIKGYPELRWTGKRPYEST